MYKIHKIKKCLKDYTGLCQEVKSQSKSYLDRMDEFKLDNLSETIKEIEMVLEVVLAVLTRVKLSKEHFFELIREFTVCFHSFSLELV